MFDGIKNKTAQAKIAMALSKEKIEVEAGNGAVTIIVNAAMQVQSVKLDPEKVDMENLGQLEKWLESGFNQATKRSMEAMASMVQNSDLDLPGV